MSEAADKAVPCLNCGYDVTGMKPESVCPECAQSVLASVHAGDLVYSDPKYVQVLVDGAWTLRWSVGSFCLGLFAAVLAVLAANSRAASDLAFVMALLSAGSLMLGVVCWCVGLGRLSLPEAHSAWSESRWSSRRLTRYSNRCVVILIPVVFVSLIAARAGILVFLIPIALLVLAVFVQFFSSVALLTRLGKLAGDKSKHTLPLAIHIAALLFIVLLWFVNVLAAIPLATLYFIALVRLTKRLEAVQARRRRMELDGVDFTAIASGNLTAQPEKKPGASAPGLYRPWSSG